MSDCDESRLKRLRIRSWRRGTKEMDMILGPFADEVLAGLDAPTLERFEALLNENDHDLYQWVTSRIDRSDAAAAGPAEYGALLGVIAAHAAGRLGA